MKKKKKGTALEALDFFDFKRHAKKEAEEDQKGKKLPEANFHLPKKDHIPLQFEISNYLKENFEIFSNISQGMVYIYRDDQGYYDPMDQAKFRVFLSKIFIKQAIEPYLSPTVQSATFERLVSSAIHQIDTNLFDRQERFIAVKNGVIDLVTGRLEPHSPKYGFTKVLPITVKQKHLNPTSANGPKKFLKALKQSFPNKDDRRRFLECCGYYISNCYTRKVAFIFLGKPHSGKSALLRLLSKMVGEENVSHLPLRRLGDRFAIAQLAGKKLNICGETGSATIRNLDIFKSLLGNDDIEAEFKGRDMFSFSGRCKCLFAANKMPLIDDRIADDAIFDRFEFVEFAHAIPPKKRIPDFESTLMEDEDSQILGLMISALRSWYRNGREFTESKASTAQKKQFVQQNKGTDFVKKFLRDRCKFSSESHVSNSDLYVAYRAYCEKNCFSALPPRTFIKRVLQDPRMAKHRFHHSENSQYYGIKGLHLKKA